MKKLIIFAVIAALFMSFSLTAFAQSDGVGIDKDEYLGDTNGDNVEEINSDAPIEDSDAPEVASNGYKLALTVIFTALGAIALGGASAAVFIAVKSKRLQK